jgi:RNA-directed DNA polymerase
MSDQPLIKHWLSIEVLDFRDILPILVGVPQGESLSPLFANIYLTPLDKFFEESGFRFVRYADDIVIFTKSEDEAKKALLDMEQFLISRLKLQLKPAKTGYVLIENGFDFLGFRITLKNWAVKTDRIDTVKQVLYRHIKKLGEMTSTLQQNMESITRLNAIIRGVKNYFFIPDEVLIADQMRSLVEYLEQTANFYLPAKIRNDPVWICK